tara:strand:- start:817 stop:1167 length:351 start_codon:yes stop_codon:yes gene_type:complete
MDQAECLKETNMKTLQFVKTSKSYNSNHGGQIFYIFFKGIDKSFRTVLFDNMRNFKNWTEVLSNAQRGDYITNLRMTSYKGKEIVNADSMPLLISQREMYEKECERFEDHYGIPPN